MSYSLFISDACFFSPKLAFLNALSHELVLFGGVYSYIPVAHDYIMPGFNVHRGSQRYPTHLKYHMKVCNRSCKKPHSTLLINPWFSHEPSHLPGSRGSCHHFNSVAHCLYNQRQLHLCSFHLPGRLMCCSHSEGFGHSRVHDLRL